MIYPLQIKRLLLVQDIEKEKCQRLLLLFTRTFFVSYLCLCTLNMIYY